MNELDHRNVWCGSAQPNKAWKQQKMHKGLQLSPAILMFDSFQSRAASGERRLWRRFDSITVLPRWETMQAKIRLWTLKSKVASSSLDEKHATTSIFSEKFGSLSSGTGWKAGNGSHWTVDTASDQLKTKISNFRYGKAKQRSIHPKVPRTELRCS